MWIKLLTTFVKYSTKVSNHNKSKRINKTGVKRLKMSTLHGGKISH